MMKKLWIVLIGMVVLLTQGNGTLQAEEKNKVLFFTGFDHGLGTNQLGGIQGGDNEAPGVCYPTVNFTSSSSSGPTGESLKISYDIKEAGSFTYYWTKMGAFINEQEGSTITADLSRYNYMGFWVKGKEGRERFKIEIHQDNDADGKYIAGKDFTSFVYVDNYLRKGIEKDWQKVVIPLKDFKKITDWSKIVEIVITFENFANIHKRGEVYLDDIVFGTSLKKYSENPAPLEFKLKNDSLRIDGVTVKEGTELSSIDSFVVVVDGNMADIESVWMVASYDGYSWLALGKAFTTGSNVISAPCQGFDLDRTKTFMLDVWAFDSTGQKVSLEKPILKIKLKPLADSAFLEEIEKRTFKFFWDGWNSESGLFWDSTGNRFSSIAATGFGLSAYCLAAERNWAPKEEVKKRVAKTVDTFLNKAQNKSGFFYHFLNMNDASRFGACEISVVDTAILMWGLLNASEYFQGEIKDQVEKIYERIVWKDFLIQDPKDVHYNHFRMGWNPGGGPNGTYLDAFWDYYSDEVLLISLLAVGSPANAVDPAVFYAWKREKGNYGMGRPFIQAWHGGLFCYQYAHGWINFEGIKDKDGINWWQNSVDATVANRQFCLDQMNRFKTYGPQTWGITSMAYPNVTENGEMVQIFEDYTMNYGSLPCGTGFPLHDGTVSPSGPAGSISYLPDQVIATLKNIIMKHPESWGQYGFRSSFNEDVNWFSTEYYGIDLGTTLMALENYRTGFFWKWTMQNAHVKAALEKCGFTQDQTVYNTPKIEEVSRASEITSVRTEGKSLMIEDFDDVERAKSSMGVKFGSWDKDPSDETQKATAELDSKEKHNSFGSSLRLDYDVDSPKPAYNGLWMKLYDLDVSGYGALEFQLKGGDQAPLKFKIELKGTGGSGFTYVNNISKDWKLVSIPLTDFKGLRDLKQLTEFTVVFEDNMVGQKAGSIYLDEIQFSPIKAPQVEEKSPSIEQPKIEQKNAPVETLTEGQKKP